MAKRKRKVKKEEEIKMKQYKCSKCSCTFVALRLHPKKKPWCVSCRIKKMEDEEECEQS